MTDNLRIAKLAAERAHDEITTFDLNVGALTMSILLELRRQERVYFDRLNDTANALIGPEERCPL